MAPERVWRRVSRESVDAVEAGVTPERVWRRVSHESVDAAEAGVASPSIQALRLPAPGTRRGKGACPAMVMPTTRRGGVGTRPERTVETFDTRPIPKTVLITLGEKMSESWRDTFNVEPCDPKGMKVLLLKGGTSTEREISLLSGEGVANGLCEAGFEVQEVDTGKDGYLHEIADSECDVVFICLHGKNGEDGTVQGLCELMGKPYVGPGVLASALAMDKARAKTIYRANGLPIPASMTLRIGNEIPTDGIIAMVGEKTVVKPSSEGSAVGVSIAHTPGELNDAISIAFRDDNTVLVEEYIPGIEVTVAVLGNDDPVALPVIEIVPKNEFYDYESKYAPGGSNHIIPARISDEATEECKRLGVAAHKALGCRGVSRTDMIVDASGQPWILETNTLPGMTTVSLLPDAARKVGIEYPQLCKLLVEYALESARAEENPQAGVRP